MGKLINWYDKWSEEVEEVNSWNEAFQVELNKFIMIIFVNGGSEISIVTIWVVEFLICYDLLTCYRLLLDR